MPLENLLHVKARTEAEILARIITAAAPAQAQHDELLTVEIAAQRLKLSRDYLYEHFDDLPFVCPIGSKKLFSSNGMDAYIRNQGKNDSLTARQQRSKLGLV